VANLTDDRGQIILVAAFALGVIFIALAVVVNAAIFTENLATRGEATSDSDALHYRHEVEESAGRALDYVNAEADSGVLESTLETRVAANVTDISLQGSRQKARLGRVVTVEYVSGSENFGTRLENTSGTFESDSGNNDWDVARDVPQTRDFVLNVSDVSTLSGTQSGAFNISVNQPLGGPHWNMSVHRPAADTVEVTVNNTDEDVASCQQSVARNFKIDVTSGTVGGEPCHALQVNDSDMMWFPSDVASPYTIEFNHANQIEGGYRLTIDDGTIPDFPLTSTSERTDAIYSLDVRYIYQTPSLYYETDVRVAPGEPDA